MTDAPTSKLITDQLFDWLDLLDGMTGYRGEIPDHPPTLPNDDRVAPYWILYPSPGKPGDRGQVDLAETSADIDYGCQITVAAGYCEDCEYAVDRLHARAYRWSPALPGVAAGLLIPPTGYTPPPVTASREIVPPRFSTVLQYRLTATS